MIQITNCEPISLLPMISKIFGRVLLDQIEKFAENILSSILCSSRKVHYTQHVLLDLLKNWQKTLEKSGVTVTVLMELSKAYDCLPHILLIAKLTAYGFEDSASSLISYCPSRRYQRVKIGSVFSSYLAILRGIPQGSILGPILFHIFINDLIFFIYFSCSFNYKEAAHKLSNDTHIVLNWFKVNSIVAIEMFLGSKIKN